jgi:hypothetical protein
MTPLTIATPFAGTERPWLDRWLDMEAALLRKSPAFVLWLDNSRSDSFHALLQEAKARLPAAVRIVKVPLHLGEFAAPAGFVRNLAVCLIWQQAVSMLETRRVLCLESDVLAPADAPERLAEALDRAECLAAVSGAIPWWDDQGTHLMVWRRLTERQTRVATTATGLVERVADPGSERVWLPWHDQGRYGAEIVDAVPFGCLLAEVEALRTVPLHTPAFPVGYDQQWCHELFLRGRAVAVHWEVRCGHIKPAPDGGSRDYA